MEKLVELVETAHAGRSLRYRIRGFGQSAKLLRFTIGSDDQDLSASTAETISVAEYFAKRYSPLNYPHLPCIEARKSIQQRTHWLPMETVRVFRCLRISMKRKHWRF